MDSTDFQSLAQLGFATSIASWFVYWVTAQVSKSIANNTTAILGLQLILAELYRIMLQHDAQIRLLKNGVSEEEKTMAHKQAEKMFEQAANEADRLIAAIEKTYERLK